jgi:hypothetical protein
MRRLAPDLFDRRFDDLIETGRSRLPSLAPRWTDYNAHDPGITLMELLAWIGEAQLYSLARMRRDERAAYAALLGLRAEGPVPARGSLWPDRTDQNSPVLSFQQAIVLESDAPVRTTAAETPQFHPTHRILWTPGRVVSLRSRLADGTLIDQTRSNEHGDRAFEPFGAQAGPADLLRLEFATNGDRGLFPAQRALANGALWPLGVRVDAPAVRPVSDTSSSALAPAALSVVMRIGSERVEVPVVDDTTRGFMQSGVLLLDVTAVPGSPTAFTIEICARRGFARPPRILRIEPGVLPIVQGGLVSHEAHAALGGPAQRIELDVPGLRFGAGVPPVKVEVVESGLRREWRRVDDLSASGPGDLDYELDPASETLAFGNGVNGYLPPFAAQIFVDYPYCDGAGANTPRNQRWLVRGIAGMFGVNLEAVSGGADASSDLDLRREARRRLHEAHALVTAADVENAARALGDLEVARAKVAAIATQIDTPPEITLLALRARVSADEPAQAPETPRWLAAVRRALLARMPLSTRLTVRAPGYRSFSLNASIEVLPRRNPADIEQAVRLRLRDAFTLVPRANLTPREFGAPVTARDLAALIRAVPGVRRTIELVMSVGGNIVPELVPKRLELARLDLASSQITAQRASDGGAR